MKIIAVIQATFAVAKRKPETDTESDTRAKLTSQWEQLVDLVRYINFYF